MFRLLNWSTFQELNIAVLFENRTDREVHTGYCLPKVELKDYNVMIDWRNFFDQPVKIDWRTYDDVQKTSTHQGDDYQLVVY